jgi:penicillin-binding protein 1A
MARKTRRVEDEFAEMWEPPRKRSWLRRFLIITLTLLTFGLALGAVAVMVIYQRLAADLPQVGELEDFQPSLVTKIYDRDGNVLADFFIEKRILVPLTEVPMHVQQATIAAEDSRFYTHHGVDLVGIMRALTVNLRARGTKEGASTITQQVARSLFLNNERTMTRKLREAILAYRIEQHYSKDQILEMYLNQIFYGHNAYGIEAAAQLYFNKSAKDLTLNEGTLIAGLPPAPNLYSPLKKPQTSVKRREHVLKRMVEEGYLTVDEANEVNQESLVIDARRSTTQVTRAPYFVEHVRQYLEDKYGPTALYRGGFAVETTLDMRIQQAAEEALKHGLLIVDKRHGVYKGPDHHINLTGNPQADAPLLTAVTLAGVTDLNITEGEILPGVITQVREADMTVAIKAGRGTLNYDGMTWVRTVTIPPGSKPRRRPSMPNVFRRGDVIRVRVTKIQAGNRPHMLALEQEPLVQGALAVIEADSGHVLAIVGGYDFTQSQFNRAVQAQRQPGSAFKPIVFAAAIEEGMTPVSIVQDAPLSLKLPDGKTWRPENSDRKFYGPMTLRAALAQSRNLVTVRLMEQMGIKHLCDYAKNMGITSTLKCYPSMALGGSSVNLLELTAVYGVLANGGIYARPIFITSLVDRYGKVLEAQYQDARRVMSPEVAYITTSMLESVIKQGTGTTVKALDRPAAGKTGTTNAFHDAWFVGYTPEMIAGVWVGLDDYSPLGPRETGGRTAGPIWLEFMKEALKGVPVRDFSIPSSVRFVHVERKSDIAIAGSARDKEKETFFEVFVDGAPIPTNLTAPPVPLKRPTVKKRLPSSPSSTPTPSVEVPAMPTPAGDSEADDDSPNE